MEEKERCCSAGECGWRGVKKPKTQSIIFHKLLYFAFLYFIYFLVKKKIDYYVVADTRVRLFALLTTITHIDYQRYFFRDFGICIMYVPKLSIVIDR